jgi:hypothetical protein
MVEHHAHVERRPSGGARARLRSLKRKKRVPSGAGVLSLPCGCSNEMPPITTRSASAR